MFGEVPLTGLVKDESCFSRDLRAYSFLKHEIWCVLKIQCKEPVQAACIFDLEL